MQTTWTLGEVMRLGLLKNHKGEPYRHKQTVQKLIAKSRKKKTPWGQGYAVTQAEIDRLNRRWK